MKYLKIKDELREQFTKNGICIFSIEFDNEDGYVDVIGYNEELKLEYDLEEIEIIK